MDCLREAQKSQRPVKSRLGFAAAQGPPLVSYVLIAASVVVYVLAPLMIDGFWQHALGLWPSFVPEIAQQAPNAGDEWWRWITSAFIHFGVLHLAINMFVLFQFGPPLEQALGRARFVALYAGALVGSAAFIELLGPTGSVHGGASGAIFGLVAAYAIVLRKLRLPFQSLAVIFGVWLVAGFVIPGISWQGHLGGAVAGAIIMLVMLRSVERSPR